MRRLWGRAERGQRVIVVPNHPRQNYSLSITVILDLTLPQGFAIVMATTGTQNAQNFAQAIDIAVDMGIIRQHRKLILDNARTHTAAQTREHLRDSLLAAGARLIFLPAYSPECNACRVSQESQV
jgi:hypothetical protein